MPNLKHISLKKKTILLTRRLENTKSDNPLVLELTATERSQLRGRKQTICGMDLLLQLPREGPLSEGEILVGEDDFPQILVTAARENLLEVTAKSFNELMKAVYHLGNRHVDLELSQNKIYLQEDMVLEKMLLQRDLVIKNVIRSFHPEDGAYTQNHSN